MNEPNHPSISFQGSGLKKSIQLSISVVGQVTVHRYSTENGLSAEIVGIDKSEEMIRKAREDYPDQKWLIADAASFKSDLLFDIVFSNATL